MVVTLTVSCMLTVHASDEISELHMSEDEVVAQVNRILFPSCTNIHIALRCIQIRVLILAGYETTSSPYFLPTATNFHQLID
jgi:hypothetical protein